MTSTEGVLCIAVVMLACGDDQQDQRASPATPEAPPAALAALPCAAWPEPADAGPPAVELVFGSRRARVNGPVLEFVRSRGDDVLVIGILADGRGADSHTLSALAGHTSQFADRGVELVVMLGGMASTSEQLAALVDVVASPRPWPIIVLPGDRESVDAVRDVTSRAAAAGRVINGSAIRIIEMDQAVVGTFPGLADAARLIEGHRGCLHRRQDAESLAEHLARYPLPRVWLSYAPPRTEAPTGSDIAPGGLHIGESLQVSSITSSGASLVVHGAIDAPAPERGSATVGQSPAVSVAAGSLDPLPADVGGATPNRSTSMIVEIGPKEIRWQRLPLP